MKDLKGKVAVITGAGSGIGSELAIHCAREAMHVVLADVDATGLLGTAGLLKATGAQTLIVKCDVRKADEVEGLAEQSVRRFGAAHLLFNNAGVTVSGPTWTTTVDDWKWVLDVNLMGVVQGIRSFLPLMLKQGDECHVVNTASAAGLVPVPGSSVYCASKYAVVALSECLAQELRMAKARIGVSVLCPSFVNTRIADSARNRPAELPATNPLASLYEEHLRQLVRAGTLSAAEVAHKTMEAVKANRFYIITHATTRKAVEARAGAILEDRFPASPF